MGNICSFGRNIVFDVRCVTIRINQLKLDPDLPSLLVRCQASLKRDSALPSLSLAVTGIYRTSYDYLTSAVWYKCLEFPSHSHGGDQDQAQDRNPG